MRKPFNAGGKGIDQLRIIYTDLVGRSIMTIDANNVGVFTTWLDVLEELCA